MKIVAIGSSAGGLEAVRKLLAQLPGDTGMAFLLVQHLDPTHPSMLVELLSKAGPLAVVEAVDGMRLLPDQLHILPPGADMTVTGHVVNVQPSMARHGFRLPFDNLLASLARDPDVPLAVVVMSGTGSDGSEGIKALHISGNLILAQDPQEAGQAGMPESAIATGCVDMVLEAAGIAAELSRFAGSDRADAAGTDDAAAGTLLARQPWLDPVMELLATGHGVDFRSYKPGTLMRRIERRAGMAGFGLTEIDGYVAKLRDDDAEAGLLINDLLINVTGFFRDKAVFHYLADRIIPDIVAHHNGDRPIRIWSAACSTGEESYSLAMLFLEEIGRHRPELTLQIFASDVDVKAVATARAGIYPENVAGEIGTERLARFFVRSETGWRPNGDLRSCVVFASHDVLVDPPFSQLDMISCRNLLIYLDTEAQAKAVARFRFALCPGGYLLLGNAESIGGTTGGFDLVSKKYRLYRSLANGGSLDWPARQPEISGSNGQPHDAPARSQPPAMAAAGESELGRLCHALLARKHTPAAVLLNGAHECVYSIGNAHRYLRMVPSAPSQQIMPMLPLSQRRQLRAAIKRASSDMSAVVRPRAGGGDQYFGMTVDRLDWHGEQMFLVCFIDSPEAIPTQRVAESLQVVALEEALEAASHELDIVQQQLDSAAAQEVTDRAEALANSEEYQTANEELLTSQEELRSLNEELTALNVQLQETLDQQRTTSDDLKNILYSADVATIFLDTSLNIRFFTPATRLLFRMLPSDIGRPLSDLASAAIDATLDGDARNVLANEVAADREIEAAEDAWFLRRVLPYRSHDNQVGGVVITFIDITERKRSANILIEARRQADAANLAKSRFLAAASHDLRQPMQALVLLQAMMAEKTTDKEMASLLLRLDRTLDSMSGMLNTLLDINQIEAGSVEAKIQPFSMMLLFDRLEREFGLFAGSSGPRLRLVPSHAIVLSDPQLLAQIIHNLVANALKYTPQGKVLIGCRQRGRFLDIEVWDTGIGIPAGELDAVFTAYHQVDAANDGRRGLGLGLGLSIVRRLSALLDHPVVVRSTVGKGSMFRVSVPLATAATGAVEAAPDAEPGSRAGRVGVDILLVEDDPDLLELVSLLLRNAGHRTAIARDATTALAVIQAEMPRPALIISDFNLVAGSNGLQLVSSLRRQLGWQVPAIILTGDISVEVLARIPGEACVQLSKPVRIDKLLQSIDELLFSAEDAASGQGRADAVDATEIVYLIDDDPKILQMLTTLLDAAGFDVQGFTSGEAFLEKWQPERAACLVVDSYLPGIGGLEMIRNLHTAGRLPPTIVVTGHGDVEMAVAAMKLGVRDFVEKPVDSARIVALVRKASEESRGKRDEELQRQRAAAALGTLTKREKQVLERVLDGQPSKNIAADLKISQRTVEKYRADIMSKTGVKSLPALARLVLVSGGIPSDPSDD